MNSSHCAGSSSLISFATGKFIPEPVWVGLSAAPGFSFRNLPAEFCASTRHQAGGDRTPPLVSETKVCNDVCIIIDAPEAYQMEREQRGISGQTPGWKLFMSTNSLIERALSDEGRIDIDKRSRRRAIRLL